MTAATTPATDTTTDADRTISCIIDGLDDTTATFTGGLPRPHSGLDTITVTIPRERWVWGGRPLRLELTVTPA